MLSTLTSICGQPENKIAVQCGMDLVRKPGALPNEACTPSNQATQHLGCFIWLPDARQVVGCQQLRQDAGIDFIGFDLGVSDGARPIRVRDDDPSGVLAQQPGNGERVDGRFQGDLVVWAEPLGESTQRLRSSADASHTLYPSTRNGLGDLSEILVDIQTNGSHPMPLVSCWCPQHEPRMRTETGTGRCPFGPLSP